jgi:predicted ATPase
MVSQEGQFIISTHSPIVMAYPEAEILCFDGGKVRQVDYDELQHVSLMRAFLNDRESFLRRL